MNKEKRDKDILLEAVSLANQKSIDRGAVFEAIETALAALASKRYAPEEVSMRASIDPKSGEIETYRYWTVTEDGDLLEDFPGKYISLAKAREDDPDTQVGDVVEERVESVSGRIVAQHAKQILRQKIVEAERRKVADHYKDRIGQLVTGVVKKVSRESIIMDLGDNAEAIIQRDDMIPRELVREGDRLRGYLYDIRIDRRGPQLMISRTHPQMVVELFRIEVPEVGEQLIEIKAVARDPGSRAKIAVKTNDGRIDPIGACVGMRGTRVQAVSSELSGERIDIVLWDDNPAQLVINAMAPAEVVSIMADEETKTMDVAVREEQLSQAIGRNGQNVRLASELTGWTLNVMSSSEAEQKSVEESERIKNIFVEHLNVDEETAEGLVQAGFSTLDDVAFRAIEDFLSIKGFTEELANEISDRARDALLARELEAQLGAKEPAQDLLNLDGMTAELAVQLANHGIVTREDLAEQAVDDLDEISGLDEELAAKLIMKARAHWFEDED